MSLLLALDEWPGLFHVPFFPPAAGEWKRRRGPLALRSGATAPDNPACFREVNSPACLWREGKNWLLFVRKNRSAVARKNGKRHRMVERDHQPELIPQEVCSFSSESSYVLYGCMASKEWVRFIL